MTKSSNKIKMPAVSVIICSYNGAEKIKACIYSVLNQSIKSRYEVIVVDDGSKDDTAVIVKKCKGVILIRNQTNKGLAESRNVGSEAASSDILVFTDDDCIADYYWLENIIKSFSDHRVGAVGGKIVPLKTSHWLLRYYQFNNPLAHLGAELKKSDGIFYRLYLYIARSVRLNALPDTSIELYSVVGANMSMRKSLYKDLGGFNPEFRFGGEEEELWSRYYKSDNKRILVYNPLAVIRHDYLAHYKDAFRRNYAYGIGNARQAIIHRSRPVVFPFPILILLLTCLIIIINMHLLWTILFLIFILYPGWILMAVKEHNPLIIMYGFVQLSLEVATNIGVLEGLFVHDNRPNSSEVKS